VQVGGALCSEDHVQFCQRVNAIGSRLRRNGLFVSRNVASTPKSFCDGAQRYSISHYRNCRQGARPSNRTKKDRIPAGKVGAFAIIDEAAAMGEGGHGL